MPVLWNPPYGYQGTGFCSVTRHHPLQSWAGLQQDVGSQPMRNRDFTSLSGVVFAFEKIWWKSCGSFTGQFKTQGLSVAPTWSQGMRSGMQGWMNSDPRPQAVSFPCHVNVCYTCHVSTILQGPKPPLTIGPHGTSGPWECIQGLHRCTFHMLIETWNACTEDEDFISHRSGPPLIDTRILAEWFWSPWKGTL